MIDYIYKDFQSHALRASLEVIGMLIGVGMSILLAVTTPYPPMLYAYIGWLISAALLGLCSWHRGSFGLATTYACYLVIDGIGLARTIGLDFISISQLLASILVIGVSAGMLFIISKIR